MIDVSQLEAATQFLAPLILNYTVNGVEGKRKGTRCDDAAPNGVYPCKGDDRWCAISVITEEDWVNFCRAIKGPRWTKDVKFTSLAARKENEDELDRLVSMWTIELSAEEAMDTLQRHGVAAGVVQSPRDLVQDPQLAARNTLWELPHSELGDFPHLGELFRLALTPASGERPAPCLGEHSEYICRELLKIQDEEFIELLLDNVFE